MFKQVVKLAAVLAVIGWISVYVWEHREALTASPAVQEMPLSQLSSVVADPHGHLYAIAHSKEDIVKFAPDGTLLYRINGHKREGDGLNNINELAVDNEGNLYALITVLDAYGLFAQTEKIVRFTSDGQFDRVVYSIELKQEQGYKRVGPIRSLQVHEGQLYFYSLEARSMHLRSLDLSDMRLRTVQRYAVPEGRAIHQITGIHPGEAFYTTRTGEIYQVMQNGGSSRLYPAPGDVQSRSFPEHIASDHQHRVYYLDLIERQIVRFAPESPLAKEAVITEAALTRQGFSHAFDEMNSFQIQPDGAIVLGISDQVIVLNAAGAVEQVYERVAHSREEKLRNWTAWAAAAAVLLLVAAAVRLIYVHLLQRKLSLLIKQVSFYVVLIVIAMGALTYMVDKNFAEKLKDEALRELSLLASNGKFLVNGDLLDQIDSPGDYNTPAYRALIQPLNELYQDGNGVVRGGLYSLIYKYDNGDLYIIKDDDDSVAMFRPFYISEDYQMVFNGQIVTDEYQDENGEWLFAIGPIYNSRGELAGIFETGKNLHAFERHQQELQRSIAAGIALISAVTILIILIATFFQLSSIRKLRNSVNEVAKGRLDVRVHLKTRDEVSELGDRFNDMAEHLSKHIGEVESLSESYFRFVPQQFLTYLGKSSILDVNLGDQMHADMNIMVSNIRSFNQLSRQLTPKENFNFMNSFLSRFGPVIRKHEGLINKYLGAGIMALYPSGAGDAVAAAVEMRKTLCIYNGHRAKVNYQPIDLGIGIHYGPLMLGIIGEEKRMEGSVISDDVHTATVLERSSFQLGCSILITRQTMDGLPDPNAFELRSLGRVRLEEGGEPLELYDVYQGDEDKTRELKNKTKQLFERSVVLYQQGRFFDAREGFLDVIRTNRSDRAAQHYFYHCDEYYQHGAPEAWEGSLNVAGSGSAPSRRLQLLSREAAK